MVKILFTCILFSFFISCNENYELKEVEGKLYKLNKRTGLINVVDIHSIQANSNITSNDPLGLFTPEENAKRQKASRNKLSGDIRETLTTSHLSKLSTEELIDSLYSEIKEHNLSRVSISEADELRILELEKKLSEINIIQN